MTKKAQQAYFIINVWLGIARFG